MTTREPKFVLAHIICLVPNTQSERHYFARVKRDTEENSHQIIHYITAIFGVQGGTKIMKHFTKVSVWYFDDMSFSFSVD